VGKRLREIGTREATREQAIRLALLEKEQKVGEQTAALERDAQIKEAQRKQTVRMRCCARSLISF
jgi:flotillin